MKWRPLRSWLLVVGLLAAVLAAGGTALWLLILNGPILDARGRALSVQAAVTAGAAVVGVVAISLAFRRQRASEREAEENIIDANERRATELYAKAAEQLGKRQSTGKNCGTIRLGAPRAER